MQYFWLRHFTLILVAILISPLMAVADNDRKLIFLEQNWNQQDREYFYFTDQGSRLIPYEFFLNLEQTDNQTLLRDNDNMVSFGFLPVVENDNNPDGLPIGLTRNGNHMGMTCAACHTQEIKYKDQFIRIDGGQSFLDLQLFLAELTASIDATLKDEEKYQRFQNKLLANSASEFEKTA